jgi:hypothetical protein
MKREVAARLFVLGILAAVLSINSQSVAQESVSPSASRLKAAPSQPAVDDDSQLTSDQEVQLWRKDLRSQKKQMVAANMSLTDAEAEKFWPVYNRYAADLAKIYDTKIALIQEYLDNYKTMNGDQAESYIRQRAAVEQEVMQLRLQYVPEFHKVLSGRQTGLFFQIEWRLDLMINMQLAQAPMIDP